MYFWNLSSDEYLAKLIFPIAISAHDKRNDQMRVNLRDNFRFCSSIERQREKEREREENMYSGRKVVS